MGPVVPKRVPGKVALCKHCGNMSDDHATCSRCRRKLPEDVKVKIKQINFNFFYFTKEIKGRGFPTLLISASSQRYLSTSYLQIN